MFPQDLVLIVDLDVNPQDLKEAREKISQTGSREGGSSNRHDGWGMLYLLREKEKNRLFVLSYRCLSVESLLIPPCFGVQNE